MTTEPEGTDEELHALVTDAIKVGDVARRYARLYGGEANTVHAAVEATLDVLLQRKAVEGSTPLDSPARPCGMHYSWPSQAGSEAGALGPCVLDVADHHERHRDGHGNEWLNVQWALERLDAAPAGEVDTFPDTPGAGWGSSDVASGWTTTQGTSADFSTPAADMRSRRQGGRGPVAQAGEPAPVPPPVDAQLVLIKELIADYGFNMRTAGRLQEQGWTAEVPALGRAASYRDHAWIEIDRLWATGVEEGRRQRDAEIHASVFTSARLAAAEAGFGLAPESVTVSYDVTTDPQTAFDLGVAEGRRQATEERTEGGPA